MSWLLDWAVAVRTVNFTFLYFGADPKQPMRLAPAQMQHNVNQDEDDIARVMVFSQKLFPRVLATTQAFMETLPEKERSSKVRLDGFAQMMSGYLQSVEGAPGFGKAEDKATADHLRAIEAALASVKS
jgi:hypothetical protein